MAKAKRGRKRKHAWSVPGLEKRVQELILGGALNKKDGDVAIHKAITTEFGTQLEAEGFKLSLFALKVRIPQLVWTKKVESDLWNAISNKMLPRFREVYSYIPAAMVDKKVKSLKGLTHAKSAVVEFKAGMGVLDDDELPRDAGAFEFPNISYHEPLVISTAKDVQVPIINGALLGIPYTNIVDSALRRALADARKRDAAAVIITNLFWLYNKKTAGFLAVFRAQWSGIKINPARFPAEYRKEVADIVSGKITDKLVYQTANEQFLELLDGLDKIVQRPNNKGPEFPGKVFVVLGYLEEEYIAAAAYAKCRYFTIVEQNKIEAELNMASHQLEAARTNKDRSAMKYWSAEVARLGRKKARTIITNVAAEHYEHYRRRFRALVVKKLEATIPNSKVISLGSTWIKIGDKIVKLHIPRHDAVTDGLLADAGDVYGKQVRKDSLADLTIECHPFSLNHRMVGREDSKPVEGDPIARDPITKHIRVAPNCLDVPFLREKFKNTVRAVHPAHKLINDPQLQGGVLILSYNNGILSADNFPIEKLDRVKESTNFAFPYPRVRYITSYVSSDEHWGGVPKRFIWSKRLGISLGVSESAMDFMRQTDLINEDIPVSLTMKPDDTTDGNLWFNPTYRPDPQDMAIVQIQRHIRLLTSDVRRFAEKRDLKGVDQANEEIAKLVNTQLDFKGEHFPHKQMMQVFDRSLDPNVDFYSAVLQRFVKSDLILTGLSKIERAVSDNRDLGVHNFGNGNHPKSTLEGADLEGPHFARHLQAKLGQLPVWQRYLKKHPDQPDFLERVVRAPHFGGETFGMGLIKSPDGVPWGIRMLGSPPRLSSWSDLLRAMVTSDLARGDDTYGLQKYPCIVIMGDKHFYCEVDTEDTIYLICAAGCHTDTYGSAGGFPPNNTGVMFFSIPEGGRDDGPVIVRMLTHDFLRDWHANPKPFNWKTFLPLHV